MGAVVARESVSGRFFKSFLYGGCSALLICAAHYRPEYWFVSLVALIPFLWRVTKAGPSDALFLGISLATSYCFVMVGVETRDALGAFLTKLLTLNVLFSLYAIVINRTAKRIGYNVVVIAVFWLPVEYGLIHYAYMGGVLAPSDISPVFFTRIGSLFGVVAVSFLIVLINSLLLLLSERIVRTLKENRSYIKTTDDPNVFCWYPTKSIANYFVHYFHSPRPPPGCC